jgi:O-antigen/teichoic acid export membrane protein
MKMKPMQAYASENPENQTSAARQRRRASILRGLMSGLGGRGVGVVVSLLSVPLTIGYLGDERYGVWALIGALLGWLNLADLGISNGFTNMVVVAAGTGRNDLVRGYISTAFAMLFSISLLVAITTGLLWPFINWSALFNIHTELAKSEVNTAMFMAITIYLISFPLSIVNRTYTSLQRGQLANYWDMIANVASLGSLYVVTHTHGGLPWLVFAVSGTSLLVRIASSAWLFAYRRELTPSIKLINWSTAFQMMKPGIQFFFIQILALIVFQTDNLLVAHFLGAEEVPTYSLTYRLFEFSTLIQGVFFGYAWVGYTDAISRRDYNWVDRAFKLNLLFSIVSTVCISGCLVMIARPFIYFWTHGAVSPPQNLIYWMAAWSVINAYCSPMASLLAAASRLKYQLIYSAFGVLVNLVSSVILIQRWGVSGAIAGTVIGYLCFVCIPIAIDVSFCLRKLRTRSTSLVY